MIASIPIMTRAETLSLPDKASNASNALNARARNTAASVRVGAGGLAVVIFHVLVLLGRGATAFVLLKHIAETGGVMMSALQSLPVAVASALVVGGLGGRVSGRCVLA